MEQIKAITQMGEQQQQGAPLQFAQQLAQLEAQIAQMKAKNDLETYNLY